MKTRFFSFLSATILAFTLCVGVVSASEARASLTLSSYSVVADPGSDPGEFKITYDVRAITYADRVGVSSIEIYKSNGIYVTTISGTTSNGLLRSDAVRHRSSYTYTGTPGASYYAAVTVYAKIGSDSDSRIITTDIIKTPS